MNIFTYYYFAYQPFNPLIKPEKTSHIAIPMAIWEVFCFSSVFAFCFSYTNPDNDTNILYNIVYYCMLYRSLFISNRKNPIHSGIHMSSSIYQNIVENYHSWSAINFSWFLHLSTDLFTLTLNLSITLVSPSFSNSIGFDSKEEMRPEPRKSSSINKWFSLLQKTAMYLWYIYLKNFLKAHVLFLFPKSRGYFLMPVLFVPAADLRSG